MALSGFSRAMPPVLVHEGDYVDDPHDPGGETNQGVTARVYNSFRARKGQAKQSVRLMTTVERDAIYRAQYWDVIRGDFLPEGVGYVVFDGAVHSGTAQSAKWLQRALGVRDDGQIGEATLAAVGAHPDHDKLIAAICAQRLAFLRRLKTWPRYKGGWSTRVRDVQRRGQAWASGSVGLPPVAIKGASVKARIEDAKPAPSPAAGDAAFGAGASGGLIAGAIQNMQEKLEPVANVEWVQPVLAALAVASVLLVAGGLGWRFLQAWRAGKHWKVMT